MRKMRKIHRRLKNWLAVLIVIGISGVAVTTTWASFNFQSIVSISDQTTQKTVVDEFVEVDKASKARAPEPTTLALFGSGLVGMIVSFVRRTYLLAKRVFDFTVSLVAVVVLAPVFLFVALLIKATSRGPALFKQTRVGKDGVHFEIYKFRTMRVDAEKYSGPVWATKDDPRLIPIGKFLRKTRLDEIPQFVNVLKGEMSIIGPRPERPLFVEKFKKEIPDYEKRLVVKPGITGMAQVWHKYDETIRDVRKKILFDNLYIKKLCLWTDVLIALRTVRVVLTGHGAR